MRLAILILILTIGCTPQSPSRKFGAARPPVIPASWATPAWFIDPSGGLGSDANSCTDSGHPCLTWGEIWARWGGLPILAQATTVTFLSDQVAPWADPLVFSACSTTPTGGGPLTISGTLVAQTTTTVGAYTPRSHAAGTLDKITASGQSGAYWTPFVGLMIHDTTRDSYFYVLRDDGTATAEITAPVATSIGLNQGAAPGFVTIVNGDSISVVRPSRVFMPQFNSTCALLNVPVFSRLSFTAPDGVGSTNLTAITDAHNAHLQPFVFSESIFENSVESGNLGNIRNCLFRGNSTLIGFSSLSSGGIIPHHPFLGGSNGVDALLQNDVVILTSHDLAIFGQITVVSAYFGENVPVGALELHRAVMDIVGPIWGPGTLLPALGASIFVFGGAVTNVLLVGGMQIDGSSSAWNQYQTTVSVTPANLDTYGVLRNPNTGTFFSTNPGVMPASQWGVPVVVWPVPATPGTTLCFTDAGIKWLAPGSCL